MAEKPLNTEYVYGSIYSTNINPVKINLFVTSLLRIRSASNKEEDENRECKLIILCIINEKDTFH